MKLSKEDYLIIVAVIGWVLLLSDWVYNVIILGAEL